MVELERPALPSIAKLAEPVIRIGGLQLNPKTRERARNFGYTNLRIRKMDEKTWVQVQLPEKADLGDLTWSRDSR
jgi:hypothetical protein